MFVRARGISVQAILIALVASLLVPTLFFSYVLLAQVAEGERSRTRGDALDLARQIAVDIDRELSGLRGAAQVLTTYITFDQRDWEKVYSQAVEVKKAVGAEIVFKTPDGQQQVNTSLPFGEPLPVALSAGDRRAMEAMQPAVSDLFTSATASRPIIAVSAPIIRQGQLAGLVNLAAQPERLSRILASQLLPVGWISALIDHNGRIVARSRAADQYVGTEATADLLANTNGQEGNWLGTTKEGDPVLSAYARSSLSGWRIAVGAPVAEVEQPLRASLQWLGLLGATCLSVGLAAALVCGRQISRSLQDIAQRASALTRFEAITPVRTRIAEVAAVSKSLSAASADLREQDSQRREAEEQLLQESHRLEALNRIALSLSSELDQQALMQKITDSAVALSGASFGAFFYNVLSEGEPMMLYTIAGASRDAFRDFPMPRATSVFAPTLQNREIIRSSDITADPRYGKNAPHNGMPPGHLPVRSYLAVPVISRNGAILGGLFLGHPAPGVFTTRHEGLLAGVAGQAAVSLDNARLLEETRAAEREVRAFNQRLEAEVADRTRSLQAANTALVTEIAQRQKAEEQLRQSQKMEAVGQLTGGIAHDFNNLLAVILGSLQMIRRRLDKSEVNSAYRFLDNAMEGANRAVSLTQRLLAFSRRQALSPEPIDPNKLVQSTSELLRRTLGEHIQIETVLAGGLWATHADRTELESSIINLAVNARDAMPQGGKLTIETANCHLDEEYASQNSDVTAGQYIMIALSDTGCGMSESVIGRAFEPFFTTKSAGQGTGLGLSQVYGFVRQSRGHVKVYSEVGQGTTVKIYLPRYRGEVTVENRSVLDEQSALVKADLVVLVVEDDHAVRQMSVAALRELGYSVVEADGALSALQILDTQTKIDLLFTDVVMPGINGRKLADEAKARRPTLKVLFTTGYTQNAIVHNGLLDADVHLIGKPFTLEQLGRKIRAVISG